MKNSVSVKVDKDTNTICVRFKDIRPPLKFRQLVERLRASFSNARWNPAQGWIIPFSELANVIDFCYAHFPRQHVDIWLPNQTNQMQLEI